MPRWWILLFAMRVAWTLIGQTGYIHPDEFFQSSEVIAGDVLNVDVYKPWEFNNTFPLRSIVLPYLTCGPVLTILKLTQRWLGVTALTTQAVLVMPRLVITIMSGLMDIFIHKLGGNPALLLFATSYINMVYYTRTLSNSFEAFLFTVLLYLVISDKNAQETRVGQKAMRALTNQGKALSREHRGRSKSRKTEPLPVSDMSGDNECEVHTYFSDVVVISLVLVTGVFNRPTFLMFALVPYVFWVFSTCGSRDHHIATHTLDRITFTVIISGALSLLFIVVDSLYYGSLVPFDLVGIHRTLMDSRKAIALLRSLTITPLNFILYNMKTENLAQHGLHPRFQHLIFNTPILFGIIAAFPLYNVGKAFEAKVGIGKRSRWSTVNKTHKILLMCYFVPLALLSVFPHQEPRFLIPLLCPLALVYGGKLFGYTAWKPGSVIWVSFNILAAFFFGIVHQGGIIPAIENMQSSLINTSNPSTDIHITFFHTYMPPRHLFLIPKTSNGTQHIFIHDLKGAHFDELIQHVQDICSGSKGKMAHYVLSPSSLDNLFCQRIGDIKFKFHDSFSLHLTTENPPVLPQEITCADESVVTCNRKCWSRTMLERLEDSFSLFMYKVNKL